MLVSSGVRSFIVVGTIALSAFHHSHAHTPIHSNDPLHPTRRVQLVIDEFIHREASDPFRHRPPRYKSELCSRRDERAYFRHRLELRTHQLAFKNEGGMPNPLKLFLGETGLCWWHSRFTRNALYLAVFKPFGKLKSKTHARSLIRAIRKGNSIVEIPGYGSLYEFSKDWKDQIIDELEDWQFDELGQAAGLGWEGTAKSNPEALRERMERLFTDVETGDRVVYLMQNLSGPPSHSLLVTRVNKQDDGYSIYAVDSNKDKYVTTRYRYGDRYLVSGDDRKFGPFIQREDELDRLQDTLDRECNSLESEGRDLIDSRLLSNLPITDTEELAELSYHFSPERHEFKHLPWNETAHTLLTHHLARSPHARALFFDWVYDDTVPIDLTESIAEGFELALDVQRDEASQPVNFGLNLNYDPKAMLKYAERVGPKDAIDYLFSIRHRPLLRHQDKARILLQWERELNWDLLTLLNDRIRMIEIASDEEVEVIGYVFEYSQSSKPNHFPVLLRVLDPIMRDFPKSERVASLFSRTIRNATDLGAQALKNSMIKRALHSESPSVRLIMLEHLNGFNMQYPKTDPTFRELLVNLVLEDPSYDVKLAALKAISEIADAYPMFPRKLYQAFRWHSIKRIAENRISIARALSRVQEIDRKRTKVILNKQCWGEQDREARFRSCLAMLIHGIGRKSSVFSKVKKDGAYFPNFAISAKTVVRLPEDLLLSLSDREITSLVAKDKIEHETWVYPYTAGAMIGIRAIALRTKTGTPYQWDARAYEKLKGLHNLHNGEHVGAWAKDMAEAYPQKFPEKNEP